MYLLSPLRLQRCVVGLYKILDGKPEGKRLLARPRHKWKYIKMCHRKIEFRVWNALI
jgi:hypothetical protein